MRPGTDLRGEVVLTGGQWLALIDRIAVALFGPDCGSENKGRVLLRRGVVVENLDLMPGEVRRIGFSLPVPWDAPISMLRGRPLVIDEFHRCRLRTEVELAGALDRHDADPLHVRPLPIQGTVLKAVRELGFEFTSEVRTDGRLAGARHEQAYLQEFRFRPPQRYAGRIPRLALNLVPTSRELLVVLDAGRRRYRRYELRHEEVASIDWTTRIGGWLDPSHRRAARRLTRGAPAAG